MECECDLCCATCCENGPQGFLGPQGQDSYGVQGSRGMQGFITYGAQGFRGFQGPNVDGPQGNVGSQGASSLLLDGPQGDTGYQASIENMSGMQGSMGPQGDRGLQGIGFQGPMGNQGQSALGQQGFRGIQGVGIDNGPRGQIGAQGTIFLPTSRYPASPGFNIGPFSTPGVVRFYAVIEFWGTWKVDIVDSDNVPLPSSMQIISGSLSSTFYYWLMMCAYIHDTRPYTVRFTPVSAMYGVVSVKGSNGILFIPSQ